MSALALSRTGLAMTARKAIVSVLGATVLSRKSSDAGPVVDAAVRQPDLDDEWS